VTFDASKGMNWGLLFKFDPSFVDLPISIGCIMHMFGLVEFNFVGIYEGILMFKVERLFCKWVGGKILNRV